MFIYFPGIIIVIIMDTDPGTDTVMVMVLAQTFLLLGFLEDLVRSHSVQPMVVTHHLLIPLIKRHNLAAVASEIDSPVTSLVVRSQVPT